MPCAYACIVHMLSRTRLCGVQSLLRGLLPDSFPARLAAEPTTEKQRRFIIIDENVYATYGEQLEQVCWNHIIIFLLFWMIMLPCQRVQLVSVRGSHKHHVAPQLQN